MRRYLCFLSACLALWAPVAARAGGEDKPEPYAKWVAGLSPQQGLFTLWRKDGKVFIELRKEQLDRDYLQSAVPVNGLGGYFVLSGAYDYAPARLIRFHRADDKVSIVWPNSSFLAPAGSPAERAVQQSFAQSVVALTKIAAVDDKSGTIVIDASPFLGDVLDLEDTLKQALNPDNPSQAYHLDRDRTYFGPTKAFPKNVLIEADQTWTSDEPKVVDNVPDPRSIEFRIDYNIVEPSDSKDYMPRIADERVGFFDQPFLDFGDDRRRTRQVHYVIRWNMQPSDPTKPLSPAKHPMVFYISNNVPVQYRQAIRDGILAWNAAFERIGISDAVAVRDQPDDPNWDPDDIRYNVVRWLTESNGGGFAEAQIVADPRTGEEFHTGILFDADIMLFSNRFWRTLVDPLRFDRPSSTFARREAEYGAGMSEQAAYGAVALRMLGALADDQALQKYSYDFLKAITLHEAGHDMGLQHNFIGSEAYTAKQLQSKAFTSKYGVATSVMEYAPLNIWPKGMGQGDYWQTVLGPYDYFAIQWGYAPVPNAKSPEDEIPTNNRRASHWSDPKFAFASDEDTSWADAHAIDPRVNKFDLTNDTLGWCDVQMNLNQDLLRNIDRRFPKIGQEFEAERQAFGLVLSQYGRCALIAEHFIGGEYLSRAHRGDSGSIAPIAPLRRSEELRAWQMLDRYLFSDAAWRFSPETLRHLVYSEWAPFSNSAWAYDPPARHDVPVLDIVGRLQNAALGEMFQPLMLQRLDGLAFKSAPGATMSMADLFEWAQATVYRELRAKNLHEISVVRRNLQQSYARRLIKLVTAPAPGTPYDAQALARAKLTSLSGDLRAARASRSLDDVTRAHLDDLQARVAQALEARTLIPAKT